MSTSMTHKYIPRIDQRENNLFVEEYYSSADTKIFIDDVEQTEIAYINYSLQEQLKPIYGYASRTFDDVAIGNRIVTGTFKVSIKNPEIQTDMNKILSYAKSSISLYNENQQELMDNIDWITGDNTIGSLSQGQQEDSEIFEYINKLISLGYNLDYNSNLQEFKQQIKQFQSDNNLDISGELTDLTKNKIDESLNNSSLSTMYFSKGTPVYMRPMISSFEEYLSESQYVYVLEHIDDSSNKWLYIMTKDGMVGYIKYSEVIV